MIKMDFFLSALKKLAGKLGKFWNAVTNWIKAVNQRFKEVLGVTVEGVVTAVKQCVPGMFKSLSKYYVENKITGAMEEHTLSKPISENEIPPGILNKVKNAAIDEEISTADELQLLLSQRK